MTYTNRIAATPIIIDTPSSSVTTITCGKLPCCNALMVIHWKHDAHKKAICSQPLGITLIKINWQQTNLFFNTNETLKYTAPSSSRWVHDSDIYTIYLCMYIHMYKRGLGASEAKSSMNTIDRQYVLVIVEPAVSHSS